MNVSWYIVITFIL